MAKKFDERLHELEKLSEKMKDDNLGLEEALSVFEEGIKLARGLQKELEKIEGRVEILLNQPETKNEKPELGLFDSIDED